jgi:hypothetical protein
MAPKRARASEFDSPPDETPTFKDGVEEIHDSLQCPVCMSLLKEAVVTICGHTFCKPCVQSCFRNGGRCPICRNDIDEYDITINVTVRKVIEGLPMVCRRPGCTIPFTFTEKDDHFNNKCPMGIVKCPNTQYGCTFETTRGNTDTVLKNHIENDCRKACPHCALSVKINQFEAHLDLCPKMIVSCPYCDKCSFKAKRELVRKHECAYDVGTFCSFKGCTLRISRYDVIRHLHDPACEKIHLRLARAEEEALKKNVNQVLEKYAEIVNLRNAEMDKLKNYRQFLGTVFSSNGKVKQIPDAVVDVSSDEEPMDMGTSSAAGAAATAAANSAAASAAMTASNAMTAAVAALLIPKPAAVPMSGGVGR